MKDRQKLTGGRCLLLLAALWLACGLMPSTASATEQELAESITRLSNAVEQLAQVQRSSAAQSDHDELMRKLSLAIAYLDYRSRRIEALEQERSENRNFQERMEDYLRQLERREAALEENLRNNPQASREEADQSRKELEDQKKLFTERAARMDGKIIQLDNEITELKNQLVPIERFIQGNLEF